ncbi:NAD/NADP octopine/nopaline dehydrogenase family protein [Metallumcola ferriviriculae]|uniref:NAD/NADP octopine/nopaline dehydrogenase family protein n=1 Tax=Metallumcola ferriviriculae TaxID=3039180 RepID=A0AAU0UQT7_9FIRM|nr:NAD/NADP octopine/nopaline dehydrogenase family protein [Desulfitibacteraceae bacterium MK1]
MKEERQVEKVAILGAGNGGITAAADLGHRGFEVRLYELPRFSQNLDPVIKRGGILLKNKNKEDFVKPHLVTSDIQKAIDGAEVIMLTIPALAVEEFAKVCAPYLKDNQIVFINSAGAMSSARFINVIRSMGIDTDIKIGESSSLTYGTRVINGSEVELYLSAKKLLFSAFPSRNTPEVLEKCKCLYNSLVPASNIWETTLNNGNPETHPGPCLLNAGRIEYSGGEFYLYREGITEGVSRVIKAISKERKALCDALSVKYIPTEKRLAEIGYCEPLEKLHEQYRRSEVFGPIKGPLSLTSRYFVEDISMGLVLWSSLGKALGIATPIIDSIIMLGGSLIEKDYWLEGLTLEKLGLADMDCNGLIEYVS